MKIRSEIRELGYRFLPTEINDRLFGDTPEVSRLVKNRALAQFTKYGLSLESQENSEIGFPDLNEWLGDHTPKSLLREATQPYQEKIESINSFLDQLGDILDHPNYRVNPAIAPSMKSLNHNLNPGWTQYSYDGTVKRVESPPEAIGIFDVETFVKRRNLPLMASFLGLQGVYVWLHPSLVTKDKFSTVNPVLIELGDPKIILNYNTLFDANKVKDAYSFLGNTHTWVDLMSMHIITNGASREQKGLLSMKNLKASFRWTSLTTPDNKLISAYNFHCGGSLDETDKELRNIFVTASNLGEVKDNLIDLIRYNILDTLYTGQLAVKLFPKFLYHNPHPVTFAGHCILGKTLLPVVSDWDQWVERVEKVYSETNLYLDEGLNELADLLLDEGNTDFWSNQLDWTHLKSGKNKGIPKWYASAKSKPLTPRSSLAPVLLKMSWDNKPLIRHPSLKWCYVVPESTDGAIKYDFNGSTIYLKKIPHPKGEKSNCGNPLAKDYIKFLEKGTLSSDNPKALDYLKKAKSVSYWTSMRSRVKEFYPHDSLDLDCKAIKPYVAPNGTVTRRAVEPTWLTCSDVKPEVIGSELRSRIQAPKGFKFVGADFDAQELKIGSMMADTYLGYHGSSPMGLITMLGDKDKKTDGHSLLAKDLQTDRQLAKTLNFLMLFFGGQKGLFEAIKANRLDLPDTEAKRIANMALKSRRGQKDRLTGLYKGGTDSEAYNWMIRNANTLENRTPVTKSAISRPLWKDVVREDFMPSRCNRNIQSTGVDILHIFVTLLEYFIEKRGINGCFIISIHDEVWSMVDESQVLEMARVFQFAHLICWVLVSEALGFESLPFDYCFFSAINVDTVIRKEVRNNTNKEGEYIGLLTPSNPHHEVDPGYYLKPKDLTW